MDEVKKYGEKRGKTGKNKRAGKFVGIDLGGTKCAVISAKCEDENIVFTSKSQFETGAGCPPDVILNKIYDVMDGFDFKADAVGISCGGPLDAENGIICSPPNLPLWDRVPVCELIRNRYDVPVFLQNDADACALAEWQFGAGRGLKNMIFMTFGTGLGAGLILDGRLYSGSCGMAGEAGHIRLSETGPAGYGKAGSFEGFCSGSGIAQLGCIYGLEAFQRGLRPAWFDPEHKETVTAKSIASAARSGDETALKVYDICGAYLGRGLAVLIDILNPEKIILGSIFARSRDLLWPSAEAVIKKEALRQSASACSVEPAKLGEKIGDYAAISVAMYT